MKDVKPVVIIMAQYFSRKHIHNIQTEAQRRGFDLRLTASRLSGRRNSDVQILPRYIQRKAKTPIADGRCLGFSYLEFFSQSKSQQNFQIKQTTWTKRSGYFGGGSIPSFHAAFDVSIPPNYGQWQIVQEGSRFTSVYTKNKLLRWPAGNKTRSRSPSSWNHIRVAF